MEWRGKSVFVKHYFSFERTCASPRCRGWKADASGLLCKLFFAPSTNKFSGGECMIWYCTYWKPSGRFHAINWDCNKPVKRVEDCVWAQKTNRSHKSIINFHIELNLHTFFLLDTSYTIQRSIRLLRDDISIESIEVYWYDQSIQNSRLFSCNDPS